jgi:hypothetical protein
MLREAVGEEVGNGLALKERRAARSTRLRRSRAFGTIPRNPGGNAASKEAMTQRPSAFNPAVLATLLLALTFSPALFAVKVVCRPCGGAGLTFV